jgi:predicted lipoprotein with Yx(FWY)xxD motif
MLKTLLCVVACTVPLASYAAAPTVSNGVIVDEAGMTLYTFDKDTEPGKSACTGECATIWPAAIVQADDRASGDWSFATAVNGQKQWAYKGHPLYRFAKDTQPGQTNGDGVKGVWHTAKL